MLVTNRTTIEDIDFRFLIERLDLELRQRYGEEQDSFLKYNRLDSLARVIVVYKEGTPAGCGCFRPAEMYQVAEIKRMFTLPEFRGYGIARNILQALEAWAREDGFVAVRLETGIKQPEAQAVYKKAGFYVIENFDPYKDSPYSICMEKILK